MATKIGATTWLDETTWSSPNYTPAAQVPTVYGQPRRITGVTVHHWGADGQRFEDVANYLSRTGGNTSAHFVVEAGRAACLVSPTNAAWHAGSAEGNATTIGIECHPELLDGDMTSLVELIAWLEGIYGSLKVYGHRDWTQTACPGRYYPRISEIVSRVNALRAGGSTATTIAASPAMVLPVGDARVSQDFGQNGTQFNLASGGHTGRDYAVPTGTQVHASLAGTVVWADWANNLPGGDTAAAWANRWYLHPTFGGIVVVIDHGDFLTVYAHLNRTDLNRGDRVATGQVIGLSGATGAATGPHLHWEVIPRPFAWGNGYYGRVHPAAFRDAYNTAHQRTVLAAAVVAADTEEAELANRVDELLGLVRDTKKRVDIIWGGVFTEFSYSGKKGTNEPGIIPTLKTMKAKLDDTKRRVDIIWGGVFTTYSMSGKPGTEQPGILRRLDTMQKEIDQLKSEKEAA